MIVDKPADQVYESDPLPTFSWNTYQRGFLGILNNAYNQSCNAGGQKLGRMNYIESEFDDMGGGSWPDFVRFYVREHDGHGRIRHAIDSMADNLQDRVASIGGSVPRDTARYWSRKYIWSMVANTYRGFCSERAAIRIVAGHLDVPWRATGDESAGIDGYIGDTSVQVKPVTHLGLDVNDYDADYCIKYAYMEESDEFRFDVPDGLYPNS